MAWEKKWGESGGQDLTLRGRPFPFSAQVEGISSTRMFISRNTIIPLSDSVKKKTFHRLSFGLSLLFMVCMVGTPIIEGGSCEKK